MNLFKALCLGLVFLTIVSCDSAGKKSVKANLNSGPKPNDLNTNVDVLKNKLAPEILKIKYGGNGAMLVSCELKSLSTENDITLDKVTNPDLPAAVAIYNIADNKMIYDLRTQLRLDPGLQKEASISLENQFGSNGKIQMNLTFSKLLFLDILNYTVDSKRYVMKYTPKLTLTYDYRIMQGETTVFADLGGDVILEKIAKTIHLKSGFVNENHNYELKLECFMNTKTNGLNVQNKDEFASQWKCSGCKSN